MFITVIELEIALIVITVIELEIAVITVIKI